MAHVSLKAATTRATPMPLQLAPIDAGQPAAGGSGRDAWDRAFQEYEELAAKDAASDIAFDALQKQYKEEIAAFPLGALPSVERDRAIRAIESRMGYEEACERWAELSTRAGDARWTLLKMPAPDLKALRWKLIYLLDCDESGSCWNWTDAGMKQTRLDIQRLMPGEA